MRNAYPGWGLHVVGRREVASLSTLHALNTPGLNLRKSVSVLSQRPLPAETGRGRWHVRKRESYVVPVLETGINLDVECVVMVARARSASFIGEGIVGLQYEVLSQ